MYYKGKFDLRKIIKKIEPRILQNINHSQIYLEEKCRGANQAI